MRAAYAGSKGTKLGMRREVNAAIYAPGATTATTNQRRPLFPNFGSIVSNRADRKSLYHSLQLTLDKRFAKGFSLLSSYTLSKTLDHSSENKQTGATQTNPYDLEFDWGPANFDRRHRVGQLAALSNPWTSRQRGARRARLRLVGDGHLGHGRAACRSPCRAASTTPVPAPAASVPTSPAIPTCRAADRPPSRLRSGSIRRPSRRTRVGTFGNTGRNAFRGPRYRALDLGLQKTFDGWGTSRFQLRIEAFNVLNNVNLGLPNSSQNSANFGKILAAGDPRIMQLALRVSF